MAQQILDSLFALANPDDAKAALRFFKAGPGEYAEGDHFLGIKATPQKQVVREFKQASLVDILSLLSSEYHEARQVALSILVYQFERAKEQEKRTELYQAYMANLKYVNNWDLVDASSYKIVGAHLFDKNRDGLLDLAKSDNMWERRIAMVSTLWFIKKDQFQDTFKLAKLLLSDKQDIMHKATGWMLKEVGKREQSALIEFLNKHYQSMPRTTLRYAIEKFPKPLREDYLKGRV